MIATEPRPVVDCHTHVFCWGENPNDGFLSRKTQQAWITRAVVFLTGLKSETGATVSEKIRNRLVRQIRESRLDHAVVLAQAAVYRRDGTRDDAATHFYVSNDYVLRLAAEHPEVIPGCSINPIRHDALRELERCHAAGCRLIKVHTAIQGVDPSSREFDSSCTVISQQFTDPRRLARVLDHGGTVIAAHCGTCAFFDRENFYPGFVEMMHRFDNLYGDTAVLATLIRWNALKTLDSESVELKSRILHGSDYPFPPAWLPYLRRTGLFPKERANPLDLDLHIKETFDFGPDYASRILDLLGLTNTDVARTRHDQSGTTAKDVCGPVL